MTGYNPLKVIFLLIIPLFLAAGDINIRFSKHDLMQNGALSADLSIDAIRGDTVFAVLPSLKKTAALNFPFEILHPAAKGSVPLARSIEELRTWNAFPTYATLRDYLLYLENSYPGICRLDSLGLTPGHHQLYYLKLSDNSGRDEGEPEVLLNGQIHGDELIGSMLLLQLADTLCNSYAGNSRIRHLIDNHEIFILPLMNPDGCYLPSDTSISYASRYSLSHKDMNRIYPDPDDIADVDTLQPEVRMMMDFIRERHFLLSMSIHAGAEVVNYPWDRKAELHPFDDWFRVRSRSYADTVHAFSGPNYLNLNDPSAEFGIINGYAWYQVNGGLQDYLNYYYRCRDITFELSNLKFCNPSDFRRIFGYNFRSMYHYIQASGQGLCVQAQDADTHEIIRPDLSFFNVSGVAAAAVRNDDSTSILLSLSGPQFFSISAPGYADTLLITDIPEDSLLYRTIPLHSLPSGFNEKYIVHSESFNLVNSFPNPFNSVCTVSLQIEEPGRYSLTVYDLSGRRIHHENPVARHRGNLNIELDFSAESSGLYFLEVGHGAHRQTRKIVLLK